jgi:hypothetical protein
MTLFFVRQSKRHQQTSRRFKLASRRSRRLSVEALEHRLALTAIATPPLVFAPRAIIEVNPSPVPPTAMVAFDPQLALPNLVVPGPVQVVNPAYRVSGSFSELEQVTLPDSGATGTPAGTTVSARVTVSYNLQAQVVETITPPSTTSGSTALVGPVSPNGAIWTSYSLWGQVSVQLSIPAGITTQPGVQPQIIATYQSVSTQNSPYATGTITASISPVGAGGVSQTIGLTTQATTNDNFSGTVVHYLAGQTSVQAVSLIHGVVQDNSLANWLETAHSGATSTTVSSIGATYATKDAISESIWVNLAPAGANMSPAYQIAATDTGSGSVNETLTYGPAASVTAAPTLIVTGASKTQDSLVGAITVGPSGAAPPTLLLSEQTQGSGTFVGSLATLNILPPSPIVSDPLSPLVTVIGI